MLITIIEHCGKQYNLINPLKFEEVDVIFQHVRKYIELTEKMRETTDQKEFESLHSSHIKATVDSHRLTRIALKRSLGITDKQINEMDYGEAEYLFNKVVEMTLILAKK